MFVPHRSRRRSSNTLVRSWRIECMQLEKRRRSSGSASDSSTYTPASATSGAIGSRTAMLSVGQRAGRRSSLAVTSPAIQLLHDQYSPSLRGSRANTPSPSPRHSILDLSKVGDEKTGNHLGTVDTKQSTPGIYLNRRYAVEVNAKDAALAAEIWKKSQTETEKLTEAQRKRREHE